MGAGPKDQRGLPPSGIHAGGQQDAPPALADKDGLVLPVHSPFRDNWMPPNGRACKCGVRPVTRREAERRGIGTAPDIPDRKMVNIGNVIQGVTGAIILAEV